MLNIFIFLTLLSFKSSWVCRVFAHWNLLFFISSHKVVSCRKAIKFMVFWKYCDCLHMLATLNSLQSMSLRLLLISDWRLTLTPVAGAPSPPWADHPRDEKILFSQVIIQYLSFNSFLLLHLFLKAFYLFRFSRVVAFFHFISSRCCVFFLPFCLFFLDLTLLMASHRLSSSTRRCLVARFRLRWWDDARIIDFFLFWVCIIRIHTRWTFQRRCVLNSEEISRNRSM